MARCRCGRFITLRYIPHGAGVGGSQNKTRSDSRTRWGSAALTREQHGLRQRDVDSVCLSTRACVRGCLLSSYLCGGVVYPRVLCGGVPLSCYLCSAAHTGRRVEAEEGATRQRRNVGRSEGQHERRRVLQRADGLIDVRPLAVFNSGRGRGRGVLNIREAAEYLNTLN